MADGRSDMAERHLDRWMSALDGGGVKAVCAVTREDSGAYEIEDITAEPGTWRKGYGSALLAAVWRAHR